MILFEYLTSLASINSITYLAIFSYIPTIFSFHSDYMQLIIIISLEKTGTWLRNGNLKRETESLPIETQNNAIRTNHIKARIDKKQKKKKKTKTKNKCRLCADRDETINNIIRECSNLPQKDYKTRHDKLANAIHRRYARNLNLTIQTNGICTTQHLSCA